MAEVGKTELHSLCMVRSVITHKMHTLSLETEQHRPPSACAWMHSLFTILTKVMCF